MHYMTGFWTEMCDAMVKHDVLVLIIVQYPYLLEQYCTSLL